LIGCIISPSYSSSSWTIRKLIQRINISPGISVGNDNWNAEKARTWIIRNAEQDQSTGRIIPGQTFHHPDAKTIMTPSVSQTKTH
jgi:hypothetical protein